MTITEQLLLLAQKARNNAYAPYSNFAIGAAIYTPNGKFFCGCNVENASYPCGTCAEAGAIASMVAAGERQIAEFAMPNTLIHSADTHQIVQTFQLTDLLPQQFSLEKTSHDK